MNYSINKPIKRTIMYYMIASFEERKKIFDVYISDLLDR